MQILIRQFQTPRTLRSFFFVCSLSLFLSIYPTIRDKLILESVIYWWVSLSSTHGWFSIPICHLHAGDDKGKHRQSNYSKGFSTRCKLFPSELKFDLKPSTCIECTYYAGIEFSLFFLQKGPNLLHHQNHNLNLCRFILCNLDV